jgi:hypothetical protein
VKLVASAGAATPQTLAATSTGSQTRLIRCGMDLDRDIDDERCMDILWTSVAAVFVLATEP